MRLGTVVGRVTLSVRRKEIHGERLLLVLPWRRETLSGQEKYDPAIVVYDQLGANVGQNIAISEGSEASRPFSTPTPVDAYCAALVDDIFYKE
jgi:ethanolamine utilization protein EutN